VGLWLVSRDGQLANGRFERALGQATQTWEGIVGNTNAALLSCSARHPTQIAIVVWMVLSAAMPLAQEADPKQPRLSGTPVTAVLADVVVRDRRGALVTDLDANAVEILEDGVRQTIVLFEAPSGRPAPAVSADPGGPASALGASGPIGAPRLVAFVFEELGAEARAAANKAAGVYLQEQKAADEFVGVFAIDRALHTLTPYTRDVGLVARGVRTAAMRPGCPQFFEGDVAPAEGGEPCTEGLPRRQRALATFEALTALIEAVRLVPGRKSVLLFSEGIPLESESDVMQRFNTLIGRANRSGVSFYTVDAAGLRARSPSATARKRLREFTVETPGVTMPADQVMFTEPYVALSRLATETGGAFLDNTNELERAARRMGEDLRSHYVLGYTPTNAGLDGQYRRIEVRVKRPDVTVQARHGYLALPLRKTLAPHDVAPLLTLEQGTRPRDFRFDVDADTSRRPVQVRARVEHHVLRYAQLSESMTCQARVTMLARAVDKDGRMLWMNSDTFELSSPLAQCEVAKRRATSFERDVMLPPTAVRLDVIAYDVLAGRASVKEFDVRPAPQ
jgi:VWFA-related protein